MSRQNPARMVVHLTTPAADVPAVIQIRRTATVILARADIRHLVLTDTAVHLIKARADIRHLVLTDTAVHLIKDVPAVYKAVLNVINVMPPLPAANQAGVAAVMRADVEQMERQVLVRLSIYRLMVRVIMIFA